MTLSPTSDQLGFAVKHGAEAVVHSAHNLQPDEVMFKLSFQDAFNFHVFSAVQEHIPEQHFVELILWHSTNYIFDLLVESSESLLQWDPLVPFPVCLITHKITEK